MKKKIILQQCALQKDGSFVALNKPHVNFEGTTIVASLVVKSYLCNSQYHKTLLEVKLLYGHDNKLKKS